MKKLLHVLLLISLILTILVPLTGIMVHKLASLVFLVLCIIHVVAEKKSMNGRKYALLGLVLIAFVSGILSLILGDMTWILAVHKIISIFTICVLAVHLFIYHKKCAK